MTEINHASAIADSLAFTIERMAIQSMVGRSSFTGHPRRFNARAERYQPTDGMFSRLDFTYDAERTSISVRTASL